MKEQELQSKIIKYMTAKGAYVVKVVTASKAGVPDLVLCYKGKFYGIEVKVGNNKPSGLQIANLKKIEQCGGIAILAYCLNDVKENLHA